VVIHLFWNMLVLRQRDEKMKKKKFTEQEMRELAITFIEDGAFHSAKSCLEALIKARKMEEKKYDTT